MKLVVFVAGIALVAVLLPSPTMLAEAQTYTPHPGISIRGNAAFTAANGVVSGRGTPPDPYVISGWEITDATGDPGFVTIENTDASFIVRDLFIHSVHREYAGIFLGNVTNGVIHEVRTSGMDSGIEIYYSTNITLSANSFEFDGVWIQGNNTEHWRSIRISADNTVNGAPLRFYTDCAHLELDGILAGQIIVANCLDVRIANVRIEEAVAGIILAHVRGASISGSTVTRQHYHGVFAADSDGLTFAANRITNVQRGSFGTALSVTRSANVTIASNVLSSNIHGVTIGESERVTVVGNRIASNRDSAVYLTRSTGVRVYHNDFVENGADASDIEGSESVWDAGYPLGGNYWSSHSVTDRCSGSLQDVCDGGDGIADTPHTVGWMWGSVGTDRYPLVQPVLSADLPPNVPSGLFLVVEGIAIGLAVVVVALVLILFRRRKRALRQP